jgi:hypothetical protein
MINWYGALRAPASAGNPVIEIPVRILWVLKKFEGTGLTETLFKFEAAAMGLTASDCARVLGSAGVDREVLAAAAALKRLAGQINVFIHATGILLCLPHILEPGESVEYRSVL